jgi:pimeloyl-ACP methyl ester carboxylesterase
MEATRARTIFVLPGMGADHGMYAARPWRRLAGAQFLDWPEYRGENSIAAMAERVIAEHAIPDGAVLVGSSLGGIVACEIARRRKLKTLVLIGSAVSPQEISGLLAVLHPLAQLTPIEFIQRATAKVHHELARMFSHSQADFIRAACAAVFEWPGLDEPRIKPLRIHGTHDRMIPLPAQVDLQIDGGHLIAMTHAEECVAFLEVVLEGATEV